MSPGPTREVGPVLMPGVRTIAPYSSAVDPRIRTMLNTLLAMVEHQSAG